MMRVSLLLHTQFLAVFGYFYFFRDSPMQKGLMSARATRPESAQEYLWTTMTKLATEFSA